MKKLALIALLAISGLAQASYVGIEAGPEYVGVDNGPVRRDLVMEDPVNAEIATYPAPLAEPMVTPADQGYYYTPYGERPVANTVSGASNIANEAVQDVAAAIPF